MDTADGGDGSLALQDFLRGGGHFLGRDSVDGCRDVRQRMHLSEVECLRAKFLQKQALRLKRDQCG